MGPEISEKYDAAPCYIKVTNEVDNVLFIGKGVLGVSLINMTGAPRHGGYMSLNRIQIKYNLLNL
jgi:hypothetical protein